MTFSGEDGGPPYSEDEDLHSPIVTTSKHRRQKPGPTTERGRSPGDAQHFGGRSGGNAYYTEPADNAEDGPASHYAQKNPRFKEHRDSHFAKGLTRRPTATEEDAQYQDSEPDRDHSEHSEAESEEPRYSKDYSFTIASPDEEMHGKAVALFDFESEHQNELPLKEGQIVLVSYRHGQGWLVAEDPKTGESGLVPEEFVRLVRDIEGGLNGLHGEGYEASPIGDDLGTPTSPDTATPTNTNGKTFGTASNGEKHPPVQSHFSTSSKDLEKYPLPVKTANNPASEDNIVTPT